MKITNLLHLLWLLCAPGCQQKQEPAVQTGEMRQTTALPENPNILGWWPKTTAPFWLPVATSPSLRPTWIAWRAKA